jgi:hypothetical protein
MMYRVPLLRLLALLASLVVGCRSKPLTPDQRYARDLARQERDDVRKLKRVQEREKYEEEMRDWSQENQSSREAWSEATGGRVNWGTPLQPPQGPRKNNNSGWALREPDEW